MYEIMCFFTCKEGELMLIRRNRISSYVLSILTSASILCGMTTNAMAAASVVLDPENIQVVDTKNSDSGNGSEYSLSVGTTDITMSGEAGISLPDISANAPDQNIIDTILAMSADDNMVISSFGLSGGSASGGSEEIGFELSDDGFSQYDKLSVYGVDDTGFTRELSSWTPDEKTICFNAGFMSWIVICGVPLVTGETPQNPSEAQKTTPDQDMVTHLVSGAEFNARIRNIGEDPAVYTASSIKDTVEDAIMDITFVDTDISVRGDAVRLDESGRPVYAVRQGNTIQIYTDAERIYLNQDSSHMFRNLIGLKRLRFLNDTRLDSSETTNFSYMFAFLMAYDNEYYATDADANFNDLFGSDDEYALMSWKLDTVNLSNLDTSNGTNFSHMFFNMKGYNDGYSRNFTCSGIKTWNMSGLDLSHASDLSYMFYGQGYLDAGFLTDLDTSSATNFAGMFEYACSYGGQVYTEPEDMPQEFIGLGYGGYQDVYNTVDISGWNVSSGRNFMGMFCGAVNFKLGAWDMSSGTDFSGMFRICQFDDWSGVEGFDVSSGTTFTGMFLSAYLPEGLDLSGWDVSSGEDFSCMFSGVRAYDKQAGNPTIKTISLSGWNMRSAQDTKEMFYQIVAVLDISGWQNFTVHDASQMFYRAQIINDAMDLNTWVIADDADLTSMFYGIKGVNTLDVRSWTLGNDVQMYGIFNSGNGLYKIYAPHIITKSSNGDTEIAYMYLDDNDNGKTDNTTRYTSLIRENTDHMHIYVSGSLEGIEITTEVTEETIEDPTKAYFLKGSEVNSKLKTLMSNTSFNRIVWTDEDISSDAEAVTLSTASGSPIYARKAYITTSTPYQYVIQLYTVADTVYFNTDSSGMFKALTGLEYLDFFTEKIDTSLTTSMNSMFYGCTRLKSPDLSRFDTSKVTGMSYMFYQCKAITSLDLSRFDTSKVTEMSGMFNECVDLTSLDISSFNTQDVGTMNNMFYSCQVLTSLDVSGFDTSKVMDMSGMFRNCRALTSLDVSGFDTSNVTNMSYMFSYATSLRSLDLSG